MGKIEIVITDFDGTLADEKQVISGRNFETLEQLGKLGIPRVIATGRNMYSFLNAAPENIPIDYLIFSTGAGVYDWKRKTLLHKNMLTPDIVKFNTEMLIEQKKDFMLHLPIPENHRFYYHRYNFDNHDFETRIEYYSGFAQEYRGNSEIEATQLLAVLHSDEINEFERLAPLTNGVKVIKTTSPITGTAIWMELFPEGISKASGIKWLCDYLGVNPAYSLAVGNDYNDLDMLRFAGKSYVVKNSPPDLRDEFENTASVHNSGFTEAVQKHIIF